MFKPIFTRTLLVACGLCLFLTGINAHAEPVQWEGNGHWYDAVAFSSNWMQARRDASKRIYLDLPGHLATLTSVEENDFITQTFQTVLGYGWLGGSQVRRASEVDAGWKWITGELWSFANWSPGEPNDCCGTIGVEDGEENYIHWINGGQWNDIFRESVAPGYIIEYEAGDAQASAPGKPTVTSPKRTLTTRWADLKRAR
jgi:hypothetical protein